jgi:hypothetical protein
MSAAVPLGDYVEVEWREGAASAAVSAAVVGGIRCFSQVYGDNAETVNLMAYAFEGSNPSAPINI